MVRTFLLIGLAGGIGSIARLVSQQLAQRYFPLDFPVGTIAVNLLGSFIIGLVYGLADHRTILSAETKLILTAGLCGGFTTFSSFSYETLNLIRTGEVAEALLYIGISLVSGFLAVVAGFYLGK
jgi:CrcB protein